MSFLFLLNSVLFGIGLAMDAFAVSLSNGLNDPRMPFRRSLIISGTFGVFQTAMPMLGWLCVHTIAETFQAVQPFIPWVALALLLYLGIQMIREGREGNSEASEKESLHGWGLLVQGIATSIDALSVGFTISGLGWGLALTESVIIGVVTFGICLAGIQIGKQAGTRLAGKASLLGGCILILIGIEIAVSSLM